MTMFAHEKSWKPKLGRLPLIPGRPKLTLRPLALPVPPTSVDYLKLVPNPGMLGNDQYGDCVFAAIEHNRLVAAAAAGMSNTIVPLAASQVVANYFAYTGGTDDGAVIQLALEWTQKHSWGGSKLLCFNSVDTTLTPIRETVSEFFSCVFGVEIDNAQMYPATVWNYVPGSPLDGGHAVNGGQYVENPDQTGVFTWGYRAEMTDSYIAYKASETWVLVWDFMWLGLSSERQTQLIADYEALTGNQWTGPQPGTGGNMDQFVVTGPGGGTGTLNLPSPTLRLIRLSDGAAVVPSAAVYTLGPAGNLPNRGSDGVSHLAFEATGNSFEAVAILDRNMVITPPVGGPTSVTITGPVGGSLSATWK